MESFISDIVLGELSCKGQNLLSKFAHFVSTLKDPLDITKHNADIVKKNYPFAWEILPLLKLEKAKCVWDEIDNIQIMNTLNCGFTFEQMRTDQKKMIVGDDEQGIWTFLERFHNLQILEYYESDQDLLGKILTNNKNTLRVLNMSYHVELCSVLCEFIEGSDNLEVLNIWIKPYAKNGGKIIQAIALNKSLKDLLFMTHDRDHLDLILKAASCHPSLTKLTMNDGINYGLDEQVDTTLKSNKDLIICVPGSEWLFDGHLTERKKRWSEKAHFTKQRRTRIDVLLACLIDTLDDCVSDFKMGLPLYLFETEVLRYIGDRA